MARAASAALGQGATGSPGSHAIAGQPHSHGQVVTGSPSWPLTQGAAGSPAGRAAAGQLWPHGSPQQAGSFTGFAQLAAQVAPPGASAYPSIRGEPSGQGGSPAQGGAVASAFLFTGAVGNALDVELSPLSLQAGLGAQQAPGG
jgi:hypothetical protein